MNIAGTGVNDYLLSLEWGWRGWGFGIANMGSGVIRVIEMIFWAGWAWWVTTATVGHTANCRADLILNQFSHYHPRNDEYSLSKCSTVAYTIGCINRSQGDLLANLHKSSINFGINS